MTKATAHPNRARLARLLFCSLLCAACAHQAADRPAFARAPTVLPEANASPAEVPPMIEVRALLVSYQGAAHASADQQRTRPEALQRARLLAAMARSGEHLSELVPTYSDRPGASDNMGVVRLRTSGPSALGDAVRDAALKLGVGTISEPIETPDGYYVLERLKDPPQGPERIAAKHILISYADAPKAISGVTRTKAEARSLAEQIDAEAKKPDANWDALAAQYTDEPGSKSTGGDLGHFGHGQMVPAFEHAAFGLKVGQTSDVVETPFGFHIIHRYE